MSASSADASAAGKPPHGSFWTRELPFSLVLVLILFGVAYTTFSRRPLVVYWEVLAPIVGLLCIGAGWHAAEGRAARLQLISAQALHWFGFMVVMAMMLLPTVQRNFSANATGLAIFTLLALGTFTAGVHIPSWQVCVLGLIMALGIPTIAWIENAALFFLMIAGAILALVAVFWWHWRERRDHAKFAA